MKKGKIKFSMLVNNRGQKLDYFRVVSDVKDAKGNWCDNPMFPPEINEMDFYFPFSKFENNIRIGYSGYCKLPCSGPRSQEKSYFVVSDGIGCPLIAKPDGHDGKMYSGNDLLLTEERLKKWIMVKKRMTVFLTPAHWSPNEYLTWNTASQIAIDSFTQEYIELSGLLGGDLSLIPLCFRSVGKSGKSASGVNYRFFHGTIGAKNGIPGLVKEKKIAIESRQVLDISKIEEAFEKKDFFYDLVEPELESVVGVEETNSGTGEVTIVDRKVDIGEFLEPYMKKAQAAKLVSLAIELGKESEIMKIKCISDALSLLVKLQNEQSSK